MRSSALSLFVFALAAAACGPPGALPALPALPFVPGIDGGSDEGEGDGVANEGEGEAREGEGDVGVVVDGAGLYATLCASCHGSRAEGRTAPALVPWTETRDALIGAIDARMPLGEPERCDGACATAIADWLLTFTEAPPADPCDGVDVAAQAPPRTLRLLTRDEFRTSVEQLLRLPSSSTSAAPTCGATTFRFDPPGSGAGATRVHVAGSFNNWPAAHASGLAMAFDAATGVWSADTVLPPGHTEYKFVVDERDWIADPANPRTASDGFGGSNSVVEVVCADAADDVADVVDFAAGLPPDLKPADFPFASHSASGVVGPVFVEEVLSAVEDALGRADVRALLPCDPSSSSCPTTLVQTLGRRAFRRPLTAAEVERYRGLVVSEANVVDGATLALAAMLSSPSFLYRSEVGVDDGDGGFRLDGFERATLLAFTLTGAPPDDDLLDEAAAGVLDDADGLHAVAVELLARPSARVAFDDFGRHWLEATRVATVDKNPTLFPNFDAAVRRDLAREAGLLFSTTMFRADGEGTFDALLSTRESFVSRRTAGLYGVAAPAAAADDDLVLTTLPPERRGILSLPAVLAGTAHSDQTSPIRRGLWVRNALLCQPLPPPPPNAGGVPEVDPNATTRERFAQHTANPFCASCHHDIDPIGFGFEGFDPVGRVRSDDGGHPVDDAGDMVDVEGLGTGTHAPFNDMAGLADTLADSDAAERCFVTQVARYALGDTLHDDRVCALRAAQDQFQRSGGDLVEGVLAVVDSPAFARRSAP